MLRMTMLTMLTMLMLIPLGCGGSGPTPADLTEECPGWLDIDNANPDLTITKCARACPEPASGDDKCLYHPDDSVDMCTAIVFEGQRGCCMLGPDFTEPDPKDHFIVSFVPCL